MALIVEDGSGVAGADSYLSVADADGHHADRGNAGWTGERLQGRQVRVARGSGVVVELLEQARRSTTILVG